MTTPRMRKVNSTIREVLADEIERLTDPRFELVSVMGVDTSPDLRSAVVYVSTLDLEGSEDVISALNRAAPRLQQAVARQVRLKYTPQLRFVLDETVVRGERIESLLRNLEQPGDEEE